MIPFDEERKFAGQSLRSVGAGETGCTKPLYCTIGDHIKLYRHGYYTCPKCGGYTKEDFCDELKEVVW